MEANAGQRREEIKENRSVSSDYSKSSGKKKPTLLEVQNMRVQ